MFVITYLAEPTNSNPEHDAGTQAYVVCWIEDPQLESALATAKAGLERGDWTILKTDEVSQATIEDYKGTEHLEYFEQALTDKEVYLFNVFPRFPFYELHFEVTSDDRELTAIEAKVWISQEKIGLDYDVLKFDYWSGERAERAVRIASDAVRGPGYSVTKLVSQDRCEYDDDSDDSQFLDDAEEDGMCVVFYHG